MPAVYPPERSLVPAYDRAVPAIPTRRRHLVGGEAHHEAGRHRGAGQRAHALRHTAATEMLRHGVPLDKIGLVLRHRGIDTTAYYAKADVALLKQVAQPWPEAL
ncbi:tyrosine-type recombinase/integrase [Bradyrhizobium sp. 143]|uniref:tyrosine-type recombinase/integrase n=1 Tax=Bradyrhizobium sp. 143 TaxID=2782619 RepID=UPI001FF846DF|nr:tyrosine-type recombinase/integrase [Bradyrhizobium sp. 143]